MKIRKKYHLINWKTWCKPRDLDGLGIINLEIMNKALLAKWFWKLEIEDGLWQTILLNKHVRARCISRAKHKVGDSRFWTIISKVKDLFYQFCKWKLGDGCSVRFWEDVC